MNKDTSGPAFPHQLGGTTVSNAPGMSLRDYFAAKAMQGLMASECSGTWDKFAEWSYAAADAMLEARNK